MQDEILKRLDALCHQLGIAREYIWAAYMKKEFWNGIEAFLWLIIPLGLYAIAWSSFKRAKRVKARGRDNSDTLSGAWAGTIFGTVLLLVISHEIIASFCYPEVGALNSLKGLFR